MIPSGGMTLMINAYVEGDGEFLNDEELMKKYMYEIADIAEMNVLNGVSEKVPYNPELKDTGHDDGGVSVLLLISTSHIAIHTWPLQKRFRLCLDSCKDFDSEKIKNFLNTKFNIVNSHYDIRPYFYPEIF